MSFLWMFGVSVGLDGLKGGYLRILWCVCVHMFEFYSGVALFAEFLIICSNMFGLFFILFKFMLTDFVGILIDFVHTLWPYKGLLRELYT